jgi:hypothetical protein
MMFPTVRTLATPTDLLQLVLAAIICTACFFFFSVLLATFLVDSWQTFGSLFVVGLLWQVMARASIPASFNVFRFAGDASPLLTHMLPWPAMTISLAVSTVLFLAAWRVVQTREY